MRDKKRTNKNEEYFLSVDLSNFSESLHIKLLAEQFFCLVQLYLPRCQRPRSWPSSRPLFWPFSWPKSPAFAPTEMSTSVK